MRPVSQTAPESARRAGAVMIRPAEPADFEAIGRLTVAAYRADGQLQETGDYAENLANVAARASQGTILVAVDAGGDIVGGVLFALPGSSYAQLARPGEAEFRMLAVSPSAQGRGVGAALVGACRDLAVQVGASAIIICTRDVAQAALRLYARLGFVRMPERDWSMQPGVDLLALRLDLTSP
jgi:ribosomal protein S18 acetylase RimI-like enzyme